MKTADLTAMTAPDLHDLYIRLATDGQFALDEMQSLLDECESLLFNPTADETSDDWHRIAWFRGGVLYLSSAIVARMQGRISDALRKEQAAEECIGKLL